MIFRILIFLLIPVHVFSQDLYVADNSYLFAQDVVVFVNDDIRLETASSNLYFRGDAQLLQNTDTKNSDEGELSIYQNQTTGVYEYNFWCSPVGVSSAGIIQANVDFNGSNIHDPNDDTDFTNVTSIAYPYTTAFNGTATEIANYWLFSLISAGGYNGWNQILNTGNLPTGYGFTMKGSPNINNVLDFRGRPNTGNISIDCTFNGTDADPNSGSTNQVETLTGNPYPSALDLKLFLINPTNQTVLNGEIFFWEQKVNNSHFLAAYEGGYATYIPGDPMNLADNGTYTVAPFENYDRFGGNMGATTGNTTDYSANNERRYAAVGQGFVVSSFDAGGAPAGGTAVFDNSMRVYLAEDSAPAGSGSVFAKNTSKKDEKINIPQSHNGIDYKSFYDNPTVIPEIRIHTQFDETFYKESVIAFRDGTPNNETYNRFFDGKNVETDLNSDVYLISEDKELTIKSINYNENVRIPFGLKTFEPNSNITVKVFKLEDIPESVNIFIYDNLSDTYTDIKNNEFTANITEGVYNNRFEITFSQSNSLDIEESFIESIEIFQNNKSSKLKIYNPESLNIKTLTLFDVNGKQVINDNNVTNKKKHTYSTRNFSDGLYIVKITDDNNQIFTKKIIISNN
ncbi:T9SS type A sorting domain-containing protein [Algibacter aquimarinus]|uniref:T9SS sorting signal type C domain-containing protein n=1 Tax=Algibacter aquimarinus TaxID=1136748 RepID=A0ABP9HPJ7_9FLAO